MHEQPRMIECSKAASATAMMLLLQEGTITHNEYISMNPGMELHELIEFEKIIIGIKEKILARLRSRSN